MYVFVNTRLINKVYKETFVFAANWKTVCAFFFILLSMTAPETFF